jgi:hypothetical protein
MRLQQHRRIGTTTFMVEGVGFNRPAVFIFASQRHAQEAMEGLIRQQGIDLAFVNRADMTIGKVRFLHIGYLTDSKYADIWGHPVQIDHFALQLLIEEEYKAWRKMFKIND